MIRASLKKFALGFGLLQCACATSIAPSPNVTGSPDTSLPLTTAQATQGSTLRWTFPASIRSLNVLDDRTVAFAGSNGFVGMTHNAGMSWDTARWTSPDGRHPSFRASSLFPQRFFAVSIEDPGYIVEFQDGLAVSTVRHSDARNGVFWDAMAWWNAREGMVFGDPVDGCFALLITRDGGQTWRQAPCETLPSPLPGEAAFAASNGNIALTADTAWVFTGGVHSRCLRSLDRGRSWEAFELPIVQGDAMTGVFAADFRNAQRGVAIGGNWEAPAFNENNLVGTQDGGDSWHVLAPGNGPGYRSCVVHHPSDPSTIVAVGYPGMDLSTDGGQTWQHLNDEPHFTARFAPSGRTLWLAGADHVEALAWPPTTP